MAFRTAHCLILAASCMAGAGLSLAWPGPDRAEAQDMRLASASGSAASVPLPDKRPPPPPDASAEAVLPPGAATPAELRKLPTKELFASVTTPSKGRARPIGFYTHGCMAGARALPMNGPDWQVMRPSRDRNWGTPELVRYIERFASDARAKDGWPGLLVGDMAQPRGGPMLNGHGSHQVGLDVDIWFTPMPNHILSARERETMMATSMLKDPFDVDPKRWTPAYTQLVKRAVSYPQVARVFVHPAIKKVLCEQAGSDKSWLGKVRPWWGHYSHMHIRLKCPPGAAHCEKQTPVTGADGCGKELDNWFAMLKRAEINKLKEKRNPPRPAPTRPPKTLAALPSQCTQVLLADGNHPPAEPLKDPVVERVLASKDASPPAPNPTASELAKLLMDGKTQVSAGFMPLPDRAPR